MDGYAGHLSSLPDIAPVEIERSAFFRFFPSGCHYNKQLP